jgi:hypothetical protein
MSRRLDMRLAKLEARLRMHDNDLSRLSDAELEVGIEAAGVGGHLPHPDA